MNSKEIPAESRSSRRSNNAAATANNIRAVNRDFLNMFADLELRHRRDVGVRPPIPISYATAASNRRDISSQIPRAPQPMTAPLLPAFPIMRAGFREPWGRLRPPSMTPPTPTSPHREVGNPDPADDISYGSLPSLVTRADSSDEESSEDEEEAREVMSFGSLPSLVTRSDSSDEEEEDDCSSSLPSLLSRPDSSDDEDSAFGSLPPLLRRRIRHVPGSAGSIPPLVRRRDSSDDDSDGESDDDDSDCSDDSSASSGETYCEAAELEMETSEYYFDNEAVIDNGVGITRSQRRINRLSGPSSIRRQLSRVRCRCLARVTNTDAWIKLRDTMSVGRTVQ